MFYGEAVNIKSNSKPHENSYQISFKIVGDEIGNIKTELVTLNSFLNTAYCGYPFKVGELYYVVANVNKDDRYLPQNKLFTTWCSTTTKLAKSIFYINGNKKLKGRIIDSSNNPLSDINVSESSNLSNSSKTDSLGQFELWIRDKTNISLNIMRPNSNTPIELIVRGDTIYEAIKLKIE